VDAAPSQHSKAVYSYPSSPTVIAGRKGNRFTLFGRIGPRGPVGEAPRTTLGTNRAVQEPEIILRIRVGRWIPLESVISIHLLFPLSQSIIYFRCLLVSLKLAGHGAAR